MPSGSASSTSAAAALVEQHLATYGERSHPRGAVHGLPVVVPPALDGLTGVDRPSARRSVSSRATAPPRAGVGPRWPRPAAADRARRRPRTCCRPRPCASARCRRARHRSGDERVVAHQSRVHGPGARSQSAVESTTSVSRKLSRPVGSEPSRWRQGRSGKSSWTYDQRPSRRTESPCSRFDARDCSRASGADRPRRRRDGGALPRSSRLRLVQGCSRRRYTGTDMIDPHVAAWLKEGPPLPSWADPGRMARGVRSSRSGASSSVSASSFRRCRWRTPRTTGCRCSPSRHSSSRTRSDACSSRLSSCLDVTAPGDLEPGRPSYETVRLVRLMHAGIRHLILQRPPRRAHFGSVGLAAVG